MSGIKFDSDLIKLMTFFESVTGSKLKDCIMGERPIFIVEEGGMGKAIGKGGANIKHIENRLNKKIRLVEFSKDAVQFARNLVQPIDTSKIEMQDGTIVIHGKDSNSKAMLIGRERHNINFITQIVKRYFGIKDIKVI